MADVLLISMRDDGEAAESLSRALEGAGFSVTRRLKDARELHELSAVVIAWTELAAQSLAMVEAAQKAADSKKAIIARFSRKPTPLSLRTVPTVDLSMWTGEPTDGFVKPFIEAVRAVAPPATSAMAPRAPAPQATPAEDALAKEAAHWRRIKDSRDPVVFLEYLETYGRSGAFSDVAMMRLRSLEMGSAPRPKPLRPAPGPGPIPSPGPGPGPAASPAPSPSSAGTPPLAPARPAREPPPARPAGGEIPKHGEPSWSGWSVQARPTPVLRPGPSTAKPAPAAREDAPRARAPEAPPLRDPVAPVRPQERAAPPPSDDAAPPGRLRRAPPPLPEEPWRDLAPAPRPLDPDPWRDPPGPRRLRDDGASPIDDDESPRRKSPMLLVLAAGAALAAGGLFYVNQELGLFGTRAPQAEAMAVDSVPMGERSTDALAMESVEAAPIAAAEPIGTEPSGIGGDGIGLAEAIAPAGRAAQPGRSADVFSGQRDSGREPRREGSVPQSAPAALPIEVGEMASEASPPLRPPTATTLASAEPPPAAPAIVKPSPVWATRFDAKDLADVYPERAARAAIGGKVMLTCTVQPDFAASCRVVAENPTGEGFGAAALRAARRLKAEPVLADGTSSIGAGANVAVTFFPQP